MLAVYQALAQLAQDEYGEIVLGFDFLGGTPASPNKMRLNVVDGSYLDIWLSADGDYSYHWEHRSYSGKLYRWDNAPHHLHVETFPEHFYNGEEINILGSSLSPDTHNALR